MGWPLAKNLLEAYELALEADPVSAFGGLGDQPVDMEMAQKLTEIFLEVIIAPSYEADA